MRAAPLGAMTTTSGTKTKALCVATRCADVDQFVATYHRFCDDSSFFVATLSSRPIGLETAFSVQLADNTPVLRGLCTVVDAWTTPANPFNRPGIRLGIRRLTPDSVEVFTRLVKAAREAPVTRAAATALPAPDGPKLPRPPTPPPVPEAAAAPGGPKLPRPPTPPPVPVPEAAAAPGGPKLPRPPTPPPVPVPEAAAAPGGPKLPRPPTPPPVPEAAAAPGGPKLPRPPTPPPVPEAAAAPGGPKLPRPPTPVPVPVPAAVAPGGPKLPRPSTPLPVSLPPRVVKPMSMSTPEPLPLSLPPRSVKPPRSSPTPLPGSLTPRSLRTPAPGSTPTPASSATPPRGVTPSRLTPLQQALARPPGSDSANETRELPSITRPPARKSEQISSPAAGLPSPGDAAPPPGAAAPPPGAAAPSPPVLPRFARAETPPPSTPTLIPRPRPLSTPAEPDLAASLAGPPTFAMTSSDTVPDLGAPAFARSTTDKLAALAGMSSSSSSSSSLSPTAFSARAPATAPAPPATAVEEEPPARPSPRALTREIPSSTAYDPAFRPEPSVVVASDALAPPAPPPDAPSRDVLPREASPRRAETESRTPGSDFILPANPLSNLTDDQLEGFVDCTLYEETGTFYETEGSVDVLDVVPPRERAQSADYFATVDDRRPFRSSNGLPFPVEGSPPRPVRNTGAPIPGQADEAAVIAPPPVAIDPPYARTPPPFTLEPPPAPAPIAAEPPYARTPPPMVIEPAPAQMPASGPPSYAWTPPPMVIEPPSRVTPLPGTLSPFADGAAVGHTPIPGMLHASDAMLQAVALPAPNGALPVFPAGEVPAGTPRHLHPVEHAAYAPPPRRARSIAIATAAAATLVIVVVVLVLTRSSGSEKSALAGSPPGKTEAKPNGAAGSSTAMVPGTAGSAGTGVPRETAGSGAAGGSSSDTTTGTGSDTTTGTGSGTTTGTGSAATTSPPPDEPDDPPGSIVGGLPVIGSGPCRMSISVTPAGSTVKIDGAKVGVSPMVFDGPCERRRIELSHARYAPATRFVTPVLDKPESLEVTLVRPTHALTVVTVPAGATISIEGRRAGTSPTVVQLMGFYGVKVTIEKKGYKTVTQRVYSTVPQDRLTVRLLESFGR